MISPIQWKITETLTNAMKYADATVISIDIHVLNKMVKVQVKDNGKGAVLVKRCINQHLWKNYCRWDSGFQ